MTESGGEVTAVERAEDDPMDVGYDSEEEVGREVKLSSDEVSSEDLSSSSDDNVSDEEGDTAMGDSGEAAASDGLDDAPIPDLGDEELLQRRSMVDLYSRDYGCHMAWIEAVRGRYGKTSAEAREAREAMHAALPLAEDAWLQWLNDELLLFRELERKGSAAEVVVPTKGMEEGELPDVDPLEAQYSYVEQLVATAQQDFLSLEMWRRFLAVVERRYTSGAIGAEKVREIYEQALAQCGKHFTEGHSIWALFIAFEKNLQEILEGMVEGNVQEVRPQLEEQRDRVRALFARQLATPQAGLRQRWLAYKAWENTSVRKQISKAYNRALKFSREREPYEAAIAATVGSNGAVDLTKLPAWVAYIRFEEKKKNAHRITSLYERAVKIFYNVDAVWLMYTAYVDYELGSPRVDLHVRCCRNVPWAGEAWGNYLRALERTGADEHAMFAAFKEQAMVAPIRSPEEYLPIYLAYFDFFRRHLSTLTGHALQKGRKFLRQKYKEGVLRFRASGSKGALQTLLEDRAETETAWAPEKAREAWEEATKETSKNYGVWARAAECALRHGQGSHAREFLSKGAERVEDWPERAIADWKAFERRHGSSEEWFHAMRRITVLERIAAEKREKENEKEREKERKEQRESDKNGQTGRGHRKGGREKGKGEKVLGKRKRGSEDDSEESRKSKKPQRENEKESGAWDTSGRVPWLLLAGIEGEESEVEARAREAVANCGELREVRVLAPAADAPVPSGAYLLFVAHDAAKAACALSGTKVGESTVTVAKAPKAPPGPRVWFDDSCTAFVKNMPYDTDEKALREIFSSCDVRDVRIVMDRKTKRSKGLAYVELTSREELAKALLLNDTPYGGRTLRVLESKPTSGRSKDAPPPPPLKRQRTADAQGSRPAKGMIAPPALHPSRRLATKRRDAAPPKAAEGAAKEEQKADTAKEEAAAVAFKPKTNDDFRKMLLGGK